MSSIKLPRQIIHGFLSCIFAIGFVSCCNEQKEIEPPAQNSEFNTPITQVLKMDDAQKVSWVTLGKQNLVPHLTHTSFEKSNGPFFDVQHEHRLLAPIDSVIIPMDSLPRVSFSFRALQSHKVKPLVIYTDMPIKTKASTPLPEYKFIYGLMEMGEDQGLPGTDVQSMVQDKNGRLWLATDDGVCYFDGESIYTYTMRQGLSRDFKVTLAADSLGHIWAAGNGVDEIIPEQGIIRHYGKKEGLTSNSVGYVQIDSKGRIYFCGSSGIDILQPDKETIIHLGQKEGISVSLSVNAITEDHNGRIWIASNCGGISIVDTTAQRIYYIKTEQGISNNDIRDIKCDHDGNIWMAGWYGGVDMYNFNKGIIYQIRIKHGLAFQYLNSLLVDHSGKIWIGYADGGADCYNPEKRLLTHIYGEIGSARSSVHSLLEDKNNCIWLGCDEVGTVHYDPANGLLTNYTNDYWMSKKAAMALYEDSKNDLWISSAGNGVSVFNESTGFTDRFVTNTGDWMDNYISFFLDDNNGHIFTGTEIHLNMWDRESGNLYTWGAPEGFLHGRVRCAVTYKNGILLGTQNGLDYFDAHTYTFEHFSVLPDSFKAPVQCITKDLQGNFWIGTHGDGVYKYSPVNSSIVHVKGTTKSIVVSIFADHTGCIWIGSVSEGLKKIDPINNTLTSITTENGLADMSVLSLVEKDNIIYAGTNKGLSVIKNDDKDLSVINMAKAQGFRTVDFNSNSVILSHDGSIWWGIGDVMSNYIPFNAKHEIPNCYITGIDIMDNQQYFSSPENIRHSISKDDTLWMGGNDMFYSGSKSHSDSTSSFNKHISFTSVNGPYQMPAGLQLPYNQNHITFHFTGSYISNPDKTRYRYILQGIDKKWSSISSASFADYRNIPPGTYTFEVCSNNYGGSWSPSAKTTFTITPPWWETKWMYTLYVLLFVGAASYYNRLRTAGLRARQKELEANVKARTKELELKNKTIEQKNKDIVDSISYAKRLQDAILPPLSLIKQYLPESFVLYKPKDIVAGDFYWMEKITHPSIPSLSDREGESHENDDGVRIKGGSILIAAADCTGHGVPGAMVSVVCSNALNRTVKEFKIIETGKILDKVRELIIETFEKSEGNIQDGMDISLASVSCHPSVNGTINVDWSGAFNSLWYMDDGKMFEIAADKQPVGKYYNTLPFNTRNIKLKKGDTLYLFTDGYADQFGGEKGKKYKYRNLIEKLEMISGRPMGEQKRELEIAFEGWKGDLEQVDDVLVIGIRI